MSFEAFTSKAAQRSAEKQSQRLSSKSLGGRKHRNEVTVHGQVNELSPMWSC